jgi:glycosyltransferase involved in cell wall biosynthesis
MNSKNGTMLLVVPVPFLIRDGIVMMEEQARNGLKRWLAAFDHVIVAAPTIPEKVVVSGAATIIWKDVSDLLAQRCVTLLPLPWAYNVTGFLRNYQQTRKLLADYIDRVRYLQFAIGCLVGDWAAVAALEAIRQKRRFAIHTDRVEHKVLLEVSKRRGFLRRLKANVVSTLMCSYHRHLIQRCSLGLWHGSDCYHEYAPWCKTSYTIHDVHTKPEDCIDETSLRSKLDALESAETINICYAGRLDAMKAPLEWLKAIAAARDLSAPIRAVWFGDGPLREEAQAEVKRLRLNESVVLPGFVSDRSELLKALKTANIMLFTHVTPESPRCLLESLIAGTPIVGYQNKFAEELTSSLGGGRFVEIHDWESLGNLIADLVSDRSELRQLTIEAAQNGQRFSDVKVFAERSELISRFC